MSNYREHDVPKLETVPLVQDATHPDFTDDDNGALGALVALDGAPVDGGVPTYDAGTGKHTSQVPSGSSTFDAATRSDAYAAARQAFEDALTQAGGTSTLDELQVALLAEFYGA